MATDAPDPDELAGWLKEYVVNPFPEDECTTYLEGVMDWLYANDVFQSRSQARAAISSDDPFPDSDLLPLGSGFDEYPDAPADWAAFILDLPRKKSYAFEIPLARGLRHGWADMALETREFPEVILEGAEGWLWLRGNVESRTHSEARALVETLVHQLCGVLLVLSLAEYGREASKLPEGFIGLRCDELKDASAFDRSRAIETSLRMALVHARREVADSNALEMDHARKSRDGDSGLLEHQMRLVERLFRARGIEAKRLRHAFRMFMRAQDVWGNGEAAMILASLLEGLLLDPKKAKEELKVRLQDAVGYLMGVNTVRRQSLRERVGELYDLRSKFVHEGVMERKGFEVEHAFRIARDVLRRELHGFLEEVDEEAPAG